MSRKYIFTGLFLSVATAVFSQSDCGEMLINAVQSMKRIDASRFAIDYAMRVQTQNDEDESKASVYIANGKARFVTDDIELFRDSEMQIAVMKEDKSIIITAPQDDRSAEINKQVLSMLQDSLLQKMKVVSCETTCHPNDSKWFIEKIELQFTTQQLRESTGIKLAEYWVDRKRNLINRVRIVYLAHPYNVKELDLTVSRYDLKFSGEAFRGRAFDMVFRTKSDLQKKYTGYSVRDLR